MKVAILGSRGIPNRYGGFEELAEKLAIGLANRGHEVIVYNPSNHPIKGWKHEGVQLVRRLNPEFIMGSAGQFIYDLGASIDTRFKKPDVILQLGYTSSSIWFWTLPFKSRVVTNMDGLEWKRSKYSKTVQKFLLRAEKWAAKHSHLLVADNPEIEHYLHEKYTNQVVHIPYGANIPREPGTTALNHYNVEPGFYNVLIARMEPENHIEEIIEGHVNSTADDPLLVIGGTKNRYGRKLVRKYRSSKKVQFLEGIYDKSILDQLRFHAKLYFHGHSVGGTNPSLLEAMACSCVIVAHDNPFNRSVLKNHAWYFTNAFDVTACCNKKIHPKTKAAFIKHNLSTIRDKFNWKVIIEQYEIALQQLTI